MQLVLLLCIFVVSFSISRPAYNDIVPIRLVNLSGNTQDINVYENGMQHVVADSHGEAVARDIEPGHAEVRIFGINPDVDNAQEDVWPVGGVYVFPPTPGISMTLQSTASTDATGGVGARTIHVHYLDYPTMDEQVETVNMQGLTPSTMSATNVYRIQHLHVTTVGSSGYTAGDVSCTNTAGTITYGRLLAGHNISEVAVWTVPGGKTAYLNGWNASSAATASGHYSQFFLRTTSSLYGVPYPGIFHIRDMVQLQDNAIDIGLKIPIRIPEKTDIKVSVIGDASNSNISAQAHFEGWYE